MSPPPPPSGPMPGQASVPHPVAGPTARELRAQSVQRLEVGLFGLAAMLLLVGLANIIMQHARTADAVAAASVKAASSPTSGGSGNGDPLADIGVVPDAGANGKHGASGHGAASH